LLVFVAAEAREFVGLLRHAEQVARLDWPLDFARSARLSGKPIILAANGPGPDLSGRAVEVAKEHEELEGLVSTGFCGGLDPALQLGDIFVATEVLTPHLGSMLPLLPAYPAGSARTGKLLSLDRVVSTVREKAELRKTGAQAVEMEAAAVANRAQDWSIPFYAIRVVTDTAAQSFPLDFNGMRDAQGRFSRAKILGAAFRRPAVFPELLRLNRTCKVAAQALGDFIADTRF
jgi:adenosylhomocysteine nucleosidase